VRSRIVIGLLLVAGSAAVAGCGGGTQAGLPAPAPPVPANSAAAASRAVFQITIPAGAGASANARKPAFVSPNTQSIAIAIANGTATPGPATTANLTPGSPNCSSTAGALTCTVTVAAPVGNDSFNVTLYAGQNATGSVLSSATVAGTVTGGSANAIPIALGGVPASIAVSLPATPAQGGTPTSLPVTLTVKDASGATIVGNAPFATPITLTDSDTSGATSLSTTTFGSPSTQVMLAYTGHYVAVPVSISASATNVASSAVTAAAFLNTATHIYVGDHATGNVYVFPAQQSGAITPAALISQHAASDPNAVVAGLALDASANLYVVYNLNSTSTSEIAVFPPGSSGTVVPARTVAGASTLLDAGSSDIAVDAAGKAYVDGSAAGTLVFPANANGNIAPSYQLNIPASGIAVEPNGTLFASVYANTPGSLEAFVPGASGNAAPFATVTPPPGVNGTEILALDTAGNVYTALNYPNGATPPQFNEYAIATSGQTSLVRTITGSALQSSQPIAIDQAGYIYIANETLGGGILVYAPNASGAATPVRTITSSTINPGQVVVGP
jgi:hypothetical protein